MYSIRRRSASLFISLLCPAFSAILSISILVPVSLRWVRSLVSNIASHYVLRNSTFDLELNILRFHHVSRCSSKHHFIMLKIYYPKIIRWKLFLKVYNITNASFNCSVNFHFVCHRWSNRLSVWFVELYSSNLKLNKLNWSRWQLPSMTLLKVL